MISYIIFCIIFGPVIYIILRLYNCSMCTNNTFRKFFNSPEYIAYKQKHEKGEKKNTALQISNILMMKNTRTLNIKSINYFKWMILIAIIIICPLSM